MYAKGKGVPEDDREAVKWTRKAAEQGGVSAYRPDKLNRPPENGQENLSQDRKRQITSSNHRGIVASQGSVAVLIGRAVRTAPAVVVFLLPIGCAGPCCMDHPEGCLIIVFFNTGDNLDAT